MASSIDKNHVANSLALASELADVLEEVAARTGTPLDEMVALFAPLVHDVGCTNPLAAAEAAARNIMALADAEVRRRRVDRWQHRPYPRGFSYLPGDLTVQAAVAELRARARGRAEAEAGDDPFAGFPPA